MGIRFTTNTWRAPLQLIDCWLPAEAPAPSRPSPKGHRLLQRFVKAGWLRRHAPENNATALVTPHAHERAQASASLKPFRNAEPLRATPKRPMAHRKDGRLIVSGRIDQVCAELERLAAIEQRLVP